MAQVLALKQEYKEKKVLLKSDNDGKAHNPEGNFKPLAKMVQSQGGQSYAARGEKINL